MRPETWSVHAKEGEMLVDCQTCPAQGLRCGDCVVTALLATAPPRPLDGTLPLDRTEEQAVGAFVRAGLVGGRHAAGLRARPEPADAYGAAG